MDDTVRALIVRFLSMILIGGGFLTREVKNGKK
jgi:hypothetical protein